MAERHYPRLDVRVRDVVRRPGNTPGLSPPDITDILDLIYQQSHRQLVWFSSCPLSSDPGDDADLEAAIAGGCDYVVSFNERHLRAAKEFGIEVLKPADLLKLIGETK
jgi:predicted nucleic acid-binding protein